MRLIEALSYGAKRLKSYSDFPEYEAMVLLEEISGKSRAEILLEPQDFCEEKVSLFYRYIKKRTTGKPLQYLLKKTNFYGIDLFVDPKTFIPRPETELMTQYAIEDGKEIKHPLYLEIGTGSGAIAISIASRLPDAKIIASDISIEAIKLCKKNIIHHNLEEQILLVCADLIEPFKNNKLFDIVISNPPYIPCQDMQDLPQLVKEEPVVALDGGENGVSVINRILKESPYFLKDKGILYIELTESNIPYLKIPGNLDYSIINDQFGKKRILRVTKR
ncbi:peptide chain release factor N(5)-glutamine methyltransferase [candidate division WOR-3 bacterium]|nr:peptide chain release factor N(5)-glutamine methyltransferase [candidate division WOR-3 bacterium]MCK4529183.1 peptide chain release factor N(5)-glutamine methyltransferase [candidate division WOR-3 bacterium]